MAAHGSPYVAQVAPKINGKIWLKNQRGFDTQGPLYL